MFTTAQFSPCTRPSGLQQALVLFICIVDATGLLPYSVCFWHSIWRQSICLRLAHVTAQNLAHVGENSFQSWLAHSQLISSACSQLILAWYVHWVVFSLTWDEDTNLRTSMQIQWWLSICLGCISMQNDDFWRAFFACQGWVFSFFLCWIEAPDSNNFILGIIIYDTIQRRQIQHLVSK